MKKEQAQTSEDRAENLREFAAAVRGLYRSLRLEGFTESQALQLVQGMVLEGIRKGSVE